MTLSIYSPLNASKKEIRLLHLLPGQDTDDIVCDLEHASLAPSPLIDYEPLSYTWGDPKIRKNITLCRQTFGITTNLHAALRHLRFKDRERVLWVDAVCINQEDIVERSEQVQLMTLIYGRNGTDKRAILWLGEESEDSPLAMHFLDSFIGIPMLNDADPTRFAFDSIQWKALRKLFNRDYWSRVWIMQEATLGGATLMCGYDLVPYKKFLITMTFIARYRGYAGAYDAAGTALELAKTSLLGKLQEIELLSLLEVTNLAKATDPRDQFYGLLGLATAQDRENIIPDYSKSLAQVYDDFVRYCIGSTKSLRCLLWERLEKGSPVTTRPTWRPVYSESHALSQMGTLNRHVAGSTEAECTISDDGLLQAKGFKFDIVEDIYPITRPGLFIKERGGIAVDIEALALKAQIRRRNKGNEHDDDNVKDEEEELDLEPVWRTLMKDHPIFCPDWLKDDTFTWMKRCPDGYGDIYRWFTRNIPPPPGVFKPRHPLQSHDDFQIQFSNPLVMGFLALQDYTFFTTRTGRIGVGPLHTAPGDVLAVLYGGDVAFMLRSIGIADEEYSMVGLPFVYGINRGELVDNLKSGKDGLKEEILNIR